MNDDKVKVTKSTIDHPTLGKMEQIVIDPGRNVVCDYCNENYTDRPDSGGILFVSQAACPACAPRIEAGAVKHNETKYIRGRCPPGMAFADWVREALR